MKGTNDEPESCSGKPFYSFFFFGEGLKPESLFLSDELKELYLYRISSIKNCNFKFGFNPEIVEMMTGVVCIGNRVIDNKIPGVNEIFIACVLFGYFDNLVSHNWSVLYLVEISIMPDLEYAKRFIVIDTYLHVNDSANYVAFQASNIKPIIYYEMELVE
jgi:hypothetical protein